MHLFYSVGNKGVNSAHSFIARIQSLHVFLFQLVFKFVVVYFNLTIRPETALDAELGWILVSGLVVLC